MTIPSPNRHRKHLVPQSERREDENDRVRQLIRDHVRDADARWFQRTGEHLRIRFAVPGETFQPLPQTFSHMAVLRIGDGMTFKIACDATTADRLRDAPHEVAA